MSTKWWNAEIIYINEIIRTNYQWNWKCKFCNVLKTNNFGKNDVSSSEVVFQILGLTKKYNQDQLSKLILSFSGWEPTLNKHLRSYIELAKKIGVGIVEIQTNGTNLFRNKLLIDELINAGLDEIFLAQHSGDDRVNEELGVFYKISDFIDWVEYIRENELHRKVAIYLNIVVTKINLFEIYPYIQMLLSIGFIGLIPAREHINMPDTHKISFGFCQPNGYAELNKDLVLLDFNEEQVKEIDRIVQLCKANYILPDFHFTSPPLCVLDYPEYNLEYERLKKLQHDEKRESTNVWNLEAYKILWKEKEKFEACAQCKYHRQCLGFYKNWIRFIGRHNIQSRISNFILKTDIEKYESTYWNIIWNFGYPIKLNHYERFFTYISQHEYLSKRILEIGCGVWIWIQFLKDRWYVVSWVERNKESVKFWQQLGLDIEHSDIVLDKNTLSGKVYDLIYLVNVINDDHSYVRTPNEYFLNMFSSILSILWNEWYVLFNLQNIHWKMNNDLIDRIIALWYKVIPNDFNNNKDIFYVLKKENISHKLSQ